MGRGEGRQDVVQSCDACDVTLTPGRYVGQQRGIGGLCFFMLLVLPGQVDGESVQSYVEPLQKGLNVSKLWKHTENIMLGLQKSWQPSQLRVCHRCLMHTKIFLRPRERGRALKVSTVLSARSQSSSLDAPSRLEMRMTRLVTLFASNCGCSSITACTQHLLLDCRQLQLQYPRTMNVGYCYGDWRN